MLIAINQSINQSKTNNIDYGVAKQKTAPGTLYTVNSLVYSWKWTSEQCWFQSTTKDWKRWSRLHTRR